jgi:hypothetical protein
MVVTQQMENPMDQQGFEFPIKGFMVLSRLALGLFHGYDHVAQDRRPLG